ncbi:hypothetical protein MMC19_005551 [Ptychographa xylographoides]|nr:hypothetical protein [Ptychographa xylographoides]
MSSQSDTPPSLTSRKQSIPGAFPQPTDPQPISSQESLFQAVYNRRAEYTRPRKVRIKVGSWNVASCAGTEKDIGGWFVQGKGVSESLSGLTFGMKGDHTEASNGASDGPVESVSQQEERRTNKKSTIPEHDPGSVPGGDEIGLYVLGLQEIIDISSVSEALRPYNDPYPARKWKTWVYDALPKGYQLVAEQQLIGLLLLIFASPLLAPTVSCVSTTSVGTGILGYMGNKGAVTARIMLGETTRMVFVNCHLAAGNEKGSLERRNWDAAQILTRTKFDPIHDREGVAEELGETIGDEDFAFWFGDLNYRLDTLAGEDVRRLLMLHTRNEYDIRQESLEKINKELAKSGIQPESLGEHPKGSKDSASSSQTENGGRSESLLTVLPNGDQMDPANDPASLQTTLSSLLPHDQLHKQMRNRQAFHDGWKEGPIDFLPTYKYDVGSVGMFDSSEKKRGPSWCDRILYRTRKDRQEYLKTIREEDEGRRKDAEMKSRGLDKSSDDDILFDYDPQTDGTQEEGYEDNLNLGEDSDIVITKAGYQDRLELEYYTSHQRVLSSDHKPLDAVFTLEYDAIDQDLKAAIHQEVARELDKAENEGRPSITVVVDPQIKGEGHPDESINYGDIRYDHPKTRNITIANTGRVPATFGFIDRHTAGVAPPWLGISFDRQSDNVNPNPNALREYTLEPGDTVNVELTVRISDMDQVRSLNEGQSNIEDVLVLRVRDGRDHFLPIRGTWLQSSLGRSLDRLTRIPEGGVRRLQHQHPDSSNNGNGEDPVKSSAPREIFQLTQAIEALVERAIADWDMMGTHGTSPWDKTPGWPFARESWLSTDEERETLVGDLTEALDNGEAFVFRPEIEASHRAEALAETLLKFLDSLEDGIVTEMLWREISKGMDEQEKSKKPVSGEDIRSLMFDILSVSPAHSISLTFLTSMLDHVANEISPLRSQPPTPSTPKSPDALLGRTKGLSQDPATAKRQQTERKFSDIFAGVIIKASKPTRAKEKKLDEDRQRQFLEVLLRSRWEEGQ